jgi:predicted RNA binding protein YcfA (HicA-like mRNA interferase family)
MGRDEKQLAKLLSGSSDNAFTFEDLAGLLTRHGWRLDRVKGSHHTFVNATGYVITLPRKRPQMKAVYVKTVRNALQNQENSPT